MKSFILPNKFFLLWCLCLLLCLPSSAFAFSSLQLRVEVIKADRNSNEVDPQLKDLIKELTPVLNYSGFTLLKKSVIKLAPGEKADVILSSSRVLRLQFLGFEADQARLLVRIVEKDMETPPTMPPVVIAVFKCAMAVATRTRPMRRAVHSLGGRSGSTRVRSAR